MMIFVFLCGCDESDKNNISDISSDKHEFEYSSKPQGTIDYFIS